VAVLALLVPLAALRAAPGAGSVVGTVYDISGGVVLPHPRHGQPHQRVEPVEDTMRLWLEAAFSVQG